MVPSGSGAGLGAGRAGLAAGFGLAARFGDGFGALFVAELAHRIGGGTDESY